MPSNPTFRCSPLFFPPQAPAANGVGDRGEAAYLPPPPPAVRWLVIARVRPPATTQTWLWGRI